jgi:predicted dithiol-disulfide oxidoreductase (DUF899 family)
MHITQSREKITSGNKMQLRQARQHVRDTRRDKVRGGNARKTYMFHLERTEAELGDLR